MESNFIRKKVITCIMWMIDFMFHCILFSVTLIDTINIASSAQDHDEINPEINSKEAKYFQNSYGI